MKNEINAVLENMTTATPEPEDYTGEDGLLYCGRCRKPKDQPMHLYIKLYFQLIFAMFLYWIKSGHINELFVF